MQACTYLSSRQPVLPQRQLKSIDTPVKTSFEDADAELTSLLSSALAFTRVEIDSRKRQGTYLMTVSLMRTKSELENSLAMFHAQRLSSEALLLQHTPMVAGEEAHLRLRYLTAKVLFATCLDADEAAFGAYTDHFVGMIDAAATVLGSVPQEPDPSPRYCLDAGVVYPLFLAGSKCRDFMVRRHAIALLDRAPAVEGLWPTQCYARTAERMVEMEEMFASSGPGPIPPMPEWCGAQEVQITRPSERVAWPA